MNMWLVGISARMRESPFEEAARDYAERASRYMPCTRRNFASEAKLLAFVDALEARTRPSLLLLDSKGKMLSSEEIAEVVAAYRDAGLQQLILAVGPASGWSSEALRRADRTISLGRITLPHELAALVAAEQIYRALTILARHPYHSGH